ncbi:SAM-dependent methyltransferase [Streptomyces monticola]|uniref:SAM-dependent methyltransferase n=1 Tax=Streptomyces monticola TaxID=2666263 RepID=A0ABW2JD48_9ACTN
MTHAHTESGTTPAPTDTPSPKDFWEARYQAGGDRLFSGRPNSALVREVSGLAPGRALDLGCGEGGDALWLAAQGWQVTATDISSTALRRAAAALEEAGVADRVTLEEHDLGRTFPQGRFDLVSAHFLQSPVELPREEVLRRAAAAVAPGGVLLVVGHAAWPAWVTEPDPSVHFATPEEVYESLQLPPGDWEILVSETYDRPATDPDGQPATRSDNTLKLRRL